MFIKISVVWVGMELVRFGTDIDVSAAENELLAREGLVVENGYPVVYLPRMEGYPECRTLAEKLQERVGLQFAFIKVQRAVPKKALGGFHIDVHWGSGIKRTGRGEVLRLLLNAHTHPRVVEYVAEGKEKLREMGVTISDSDYGVISLPDDIKPQRIEIPAKGKDFIWGLKFIASKIPHVGVTDEQGLFVVGFGEYVQ